MEKSSWNEYIEVSEETPYTREQFIKEAINCKTEAVACPKCEHEYTYGEVSPWDGDFVTQDGKFARHFEFREGDEELEIFLCVKCGTVLRAFVQSESEWLDAPVEFNNYKLLS